jgi:hypothetical protein
VVVGAAAVVVVVVSVVVGAATVFVVVVSVVAGAAMVEGSGTAGEVGATSVACSEGSSMVLSRTSVVGDSRVFGFSGSTTVPERSGPATSRLEDALPNWGRTSKTPIRSALAVAIPADASTARR